MNNLYVVIMSGGEGTRFYPYSTPDRPKQFLNFIGDKSFIRQTYERILPFVPINRIYVSTGERYIELVKEHLPEVLVENIIAEPVKRNTGPALSYATFVIQKRDPDAIICCLPSDHYISDGDGFRSIISKAVDVAKKGYLVTLGMKPTWPSTDYGYICPKKSGVAWSPVTQFAEKPKKEVAEEYIKKGYLWNGGIFVWKASVFMEELTKCAPDLLPSSPACAQYFNSIPSISIDYALMEKSGKVAVVRADIGWSDVGTWDGVERLARDGADVSKELLAIMRGDERCPWRKIVPKPWGHEEWWAHNDKYVGKILFIKKGGRLSLQYHMVKEETLRLLSGELELELGDGKKYDMKHGDVYHVPPKMHHRMSAKSDCLVLEISSPEVDDIVRLNDDYGRESL